MKNNRAYTKSELRLATEIVIECLDGDTSYLKHQYQVIFKHQEAGFRKAILDLAIPQLHIAIRVMGAVHGMPFAMSVHDELQLNLLELSGWDVIDVWHTERPDLWIL